MSGPLWADASLLERLVGGFSRDGLWKNVQARCLTPPAPTHADCVVVDRQQGFVLYKDAIGASHYLIIPDQPVTGVDDARIWGDAVQPNQWAFGWDARGAVARAVGKPLPDTLPGLAINSKASRSQDQLHIHLDCISEAARDFLSGGSGTIDTRWRDLRFRGRPVRAILIPATQPTLAVNPFDVVRQGQDAPVTAGMADRGVFMAYVRQPGGVSGFVVVDDPVDKAAGSTGHASDFLDRGCKLARALPADARPAEGVSTVRVPADGAQHAGDRQIGGQQIGAQPIGAQPIGEREAAPAR
ncbi:CDP-diacylglycerol pyrophosphatase [Cupriavidus sp. YR651]|nr:CDP-diacylglycerol pyrophosphatase [Cupriavidus sp. YR651]